MNRIALESPEKPVQEFSEGESYPTTGDGVKRTRELPRAVETHWQFRDLVGFWHDVEMTDEEVSEMKNKYPELKWKNLKT